MSMKVGIISTFLPEKCGVAIYTENLIKELDCKVIKIGRFGSKADYKINFKSLSLKPKLKKIIKDEKLDVLHIQHNFPIFGKYSFNFGLIKALSLSTETPIIVTLHEVQYPQEVNIIQKLRSKILGRIEKQLVKKATKIIVHTPNQKKFLEKKYKVKNIECIYHGLNLLKESSRKDKNILSFGIITPAKGIYYLVRAMEQLRDYNLTIAGNIPKGLEKYKIELIDLIKKKKLENVKTDFRWIPEKDKWDYYKKAGIVVLPYIWAPYQSGILHNALSCGVPVVVTRVGALWEVVDKFKLGEIIKPKSPKAIVDCVKKVFKNYNYYKKGITQYRKEANWKIIGKKHLELYCSILK